MNTIKRFTILLSVILILSCSSSDDSIIIENTEIDLAENTTLSEEETKDLLYLREEEKLARDVYLNSYNKYGVIIFKNISSSEQTHMDSVLELLEKYNIEDPISEEEGVFNNPELQELYNKLVEISNTSLNDALIVGNTIEDLDIYDIELNEERTSKLDLLEVYSSLKCGSRNHLRNYYTQLKNYSGDYLPQYISEDLFNNIISTSNEKCSNN